VVTRPFIKTLRFAGILEASQDIAVGIEDAYGRHIGRRKSLLPSGFAQ
jgi:hypothetical protein